VLRVCGASAERDPLSARQCWCGGLFCGKGGGKKSAEFRRVFRNSQLAHTRAQFDDLIAQVDLFDDDEARERWRGLIDGITARRLLRVK
jgi:hypothetical protein